MESNPPINISPVREAGVARRQLRRRWTTWLGTAFLSLGVAATSGLAAPSAGATTGQPVANWTELEPATSPPALDGAASAYDPATRQLVLFGGEDNGTASGATWVWNGSTWSEAATTGPGALTGASMAYDDNDSTLYLFGGSGSAGDSNATWSWNGTAWSQVQSSTNPPALADASMAYDPASESLILFGGRHGSTLKGDSWVYSPSTGWVEGSTSGPSARADASMAFDPAIGEIVLYGGDGSQGDLSDTWALGNSAGEWTRLSPSASPPALSSASMAFDPSTAQLLLFGGESTASGELDQTWAFNGTTWTEQGPAESPPARIDATMAFDDATNQMVLFGGNANGASLSDTWTWGYPEGFVPAAWTQLDPAMSPSARFGASMAYDEATGQLVLFGGQGSGGSNLGDTWTWNGSTWTEQDPATSPPAQGSAPMAYDPDTGQLILFAFDGDTWEWDGSDWAQLLPATSPSARDESSMAFDPNLGELVLFSGFPLTDDTWAWNGSDWTQLSPSSSPPARYAASMTDDPMTNQTVLFGGVGASLFGDTWTWNGATWTEQEPATSPSARVGATLAYDPAVASDVLFGGLGSGTAFSDTWTWNGTNWTKQAPTTSPSGRDAVAMAYDEGTGQLVLFGGYDNGPLGDTWIYGSPDVAPSISSAAKTVFEAGQPGSFTVTATGTPAPTFSLSGAPSWLEINPTTGDLSGTPPVGTEGKISFTVLASNGVGSAVSQAFTLQVDAPPVITSAASVTFAVGDAGSFTFKATGYPTPTFTEAGALPGGVSFSKTGLLSGTPEAGTSGVYPLTVMAKNNVVPSAEQDFTLTVTAPPAITSKATYTFYTEETGTFVVVATGTPTPAITESGTLPKGVTFTDEGDGEGILTGVPAFNSAGTYPITFTASNANGSTTQQFVLTVALS
jgi:Putative Ig domain/Galactose oxidase, central domain